MRQVQQKAIWSVSLTEKHRRKWSLSNAWEAVVQTAEESHIVPKSAVCTPVSYTHLKGLKGVLIGVAVTHWTGLARIIRSEVLQLRSQQYIEVSRKLGHSNWWITIHHILPHMVPQFLIGLILMFPHAIMHESGLTFLGFGLSPEQPAIGIILSESMKYLSTGMWWLAFFPGLMLVIIVLLFDKLGENMKKIIDPYSSHE